ncbi:MAG: hypothetical protein IH878_13265 [Gemmatimonadetes bacterium]|nr:hypothetical protein [Gemmatimonadota bacterium]
MANLKPPGASASGLIIAPLRAAQSAHFQQLMEEVKERWEALVEQERDLQALVARSLA